METKKYFMLLVCLGGLLAVSCHSSGGSQDAPRKYAGAADRSASIALTHDAGQYPVFSVADTAYDFGTIHEGDIVQFNFRFTNTGSKPLIISHAASTCGCTIPDYPKEPVAPGKEGMLRVVFNSAGKSGRQLKPVFVTANTMPSHFKLKITCNVVPSSK